ncbi:AsmA family protein [Mongoliimonas terrestris]|uniref:AsmA family protein n=1 Tax=Mongoliimonas terrestris TaxID=1709001 RepID=UPI0009498F36|nr:AsmA family protein [Mongoliimonas terrestris]
MKRIVIAGAVLVALAAAVVLVLPLMVSSDWIRDRIVAEIERSTGLVVRIDGDVSMTVVPAPALAVASLSIGWPDQPPFAEIDQVRFGLATGPLLDGTVAITGLDLKGPSIAIARTADGRFALLGAKPLPADGNASPAPDGPPPSSTSVPDGSIDRIRVSGGTVTITGADGAVERIDDLSLETGLVQLAAPLQATGNATVRGTVLTANVRADTPARLIDGEPAAVEIALAGDALDLALAGTYGSGLFDGTLRLQTGDTAALARLAGADADLPVRSLTLEGRLAAGAGRLEATSLAFTADGVSGSGEAALSLAGDRPRLDVRLQVPGLDLDRFAASGEGDGADRPDAAPAPGSGLDLSPFQSFDGGLELTVGELSGSALGSVAPLRDSRMVAVADAGVVTVVLGPLAVLDGSAEIRATARPDPAGLRLDGRVQATGFDAEALNAVSPAPLPFDGLLSADVRFAAAGADRGALVGSLGAAGSVALSGGTLRGLGLADAFGDPAADRLTDVALTAAFESLTAPVDLKGRATFRGVPFTVDLTLDANAARAGGPFAVTAAAASDRLGLRFDGTVDPAGRTAAGGIGIDAPSLGAALAVMNRAADGLPDGPVSVFGRLDVGPQALRFADAEFLFADTRLKGDVAVDMAGKPRITARLAGDTVDIGAIVGGASRSGAPRDRSAGDGGGERGWSEAPLDFSGLHGFDADVAFNAAALRVGGVVTGPAAVSLTNAAGRLTADLPSIGLYGGTGAARVVLDAGQGVPAVALDLSTRDVAALPFLADAAGFTRIDGRADLTLSVQGSGGSERALVEALGGTASVAFRDGAVRGVDAAGLLRAAAVAVVSGLTGSADAATPFHSLTGTFRIENGIALNEDLVLDGPVVQATGAGRVDLPRRLIGYRFIPRLTVANGAEPLSFEVPVILEGPWAAPRLYPDISGILENPEAAYDKLRALGGAFSRLGKVDERTLETVVDQLAPGLGAVVAPGGQGGGQGGGLEDGLGQVLDQLLGGDRTRAPDPAPPPPAAAEAAPPAEAPPPEPPPAEQPRADTPPVDAPVEPPPADAPSPDAPPADAPPAPAPEPTPDQPPGEPVPAEPDPLQQLLDLGVRQLLQP